MRENLKVALRIATEQHCRVYLIGGAVRDLLLGKIAADIDLAVMGPVEQFGQALATQTGGTYVPLGKRFQMAKVVWPLQQDGMNRNLDLVEIGDLADDLRRRDFTINAMALELGSWDPDNITEALVLDPFGGQEDLARRTIQVTGPQVFDDDPLRVLRAVRLAGQLDFVVAGDTLRLAREKVFLLKQVSPERIRDEIFKILNMEGSSRLITALDEIGAWEVLYPEVTRMKATGQNEYHGGNVWVHCLWTYEDLEDLLAGSFMTEMAEPARSCLQEYLDEEPVPGRSRRQLLKLAALLHDAGKPARKGSHKGRVTFYGHEQTGAEIIREVAQKLMLANKEIEFLVEVISGHMRPFNLFPEYQVDIKLLRKFFNRVKEPVAILLHWYADRAAHRGPACAPDEAVRSREVVARTLEMYYQEPEKFLIPHLIDGDELMQATGLSPGREVGIFLDKIRAAQVDGKIRTREEALALARSMAPLKNTTGRVKYKGKK